MALKASEISTLIKERIENFEASAEARDVGTVIAVTDGIVRIHGLADARYGEMLEFPQNTFGMASTLSRIRLVRLSSVTTNTFRKATRLKQPVVFLRCLLVRPCWVALSTHSVTLSTVKVRSTRKVQRQSKRLRQA